MGAWIGHISLMPKAVGQFQLIFSLSISALPCGLRINTGICRVPKYCSDLQSFIGSPEAGENASTPVITSGRSRASLITKAAKKSN